MKSIISRSIVLQIVAFIAFSCNMFCQNTKNLKQDSITYSIDQTYYNYAKSYRKQNAEMLMECYEENAFYIFGEKPLLRGQKAIKKHFKKFFKNLKDQKIDVTITFKIADRITDQNLNHDIGYYVLSYFEKGYLTHQVAGKFSTVLVNNQIGEWRFASDTFHPAHMNEFDDAKGTIITYR